MNRRDELFRQYFGTAFAQSLLQRGAVIFREEADAVIEALAAALECCERNDHANEETPSRDP